MPRRRGCGVKKPINAFKQVAHAMRSLAFLVLLFLAQTLSGLGDWYARWDIAGNTWYEKWNNVLNAVDSIPRDEKIEILGKAAALGTDPRMDEEKREIFDRAQAALLAIPGHAEYYRDRINSTREKMEAALAAGNQADYQTYRHQLSDEIMYGFETLSQLPSVETVRVLGEFLFDERGYVKMPLDNTTEKQRYDSIKHGPVYRISAKSLAALPIVGRLEPPRMEFGGPEDTKAWKQWYQEIKDGKRTFRFEGDPTEYDLNGPAPKEKLERIALAAKRDGERRAKHEMMDVAAVASVPPPTKTPLIALILAGLAVLGSLAWYFRKTKRA